MTRPSAFGNPFWIGFALWAYGLAFGETDPARALDALRPGLVYVRDNRFPFWEAAMAREAAGLEAVHGEVERALVSFDGTIDAFHRSGDRTNLTLRVDVGAVSR